MLSLAMTDSDGDCRFGSEMRPSGSTPNKRSRGAALAVVLAACFDVSGLGLVDHRPITEKGAGRYSFQMSQGALAAGQENAKALKSGAEFRECASGCPAMIVISAERFSMGSPEVDADARANERPRHEVRIANPIAVSKFEATFDEWDACVAASACPRVPDRWGRGKMPVINLSWNDAKRYAAWLSRVTGEPYRLLTMGVRRARRCCHPLSLGRRSRRGRSQLRRLRKPVGSPTNSACRLVQAERVRTLRHAGQRLGVGRGCLA
jgi:hypothetical protein